MRNNASRALILAVSMLAACGGGGGGESGGGEPTSAPEWLVLSDPSNSLDELHAVAQDGVYMYLVGSDLTSGNGQWRIEKRFITDGSLVTSFGTHGVVQANPSDGRDEPLAIAIDSSFMYLAGYDSVSGDRRWRIEKRDLVTGDLETSFGGSWLPGTGGRVVSDPSGNDDEARAIVIDATHMYVVGTADYRDKLRIEKRALISGLLDTSFDSNGVQVYEVDQATIGVSAVAIDPAHLYVAGWFVGLDRKSFLRSYSLSDGSMEGLLESESMAVDMYRGIAVTSDSVYLVGADSAPGQRQFHLEKRWKSGLYLDRNFGTEGIVQEDLSAGLDQAEAIVMDGTNLYVMGFEQRSSDGEWRIEKRDASKGTLYRADNLNPTSGYEWARGGFVVGAFLYVFGDDGSNGGRWRMERFLK